MADLGFRESYRRRHPGQGTENVCYAFDNLFVELLWIADAAEARQANMRRTGLWERSQWRRAATCPFGIAWRSAEPRGPVWDYRPPYLPADTGISVACESDDVRRPMLFQAPGGAAPTDWPKTRRGALQRDGGFGAIVEARLSLPAAIPDGPVQREMLEHTILTRYDVPGGYRLDLTVERRGSGAGLLSLPNVDWI